jgi:hypothetical protein
MDILDVRESKKYYQLYLLLININTRYFYIFHLKKKDSENVVESLMDFITDVGEPLISITADDE